MALTTDRGDGRKGLNLPARSCYPGYPVTDHDELMTFLFQLSSKVDKLERLNKALACKVKDLIFDLNLNE